MMINDIPTISITQDENISNFNEDDDNDYNYDINDAHTDIEDLDSDEDTNHRRSPSRMLRIRRKSATKKINDCATDVEDYNDSDSDSDEIIETDEIKLDLTEFLDQGFVEEVSSHSVGRTGGMKQTRRTVKTQLAAPVEDDGGITDCENLETSDEETDVKYEIDEKPYDDILKDMLIDDGNNVSIQDATTLRNNAPSPAISPSFVSDGSDSDNDIDRRNRFEHSDVENIVFSDDNFRETASPTPYSKSAFDVEEITLEASDYEGPLDNVPAEEVKITFIPDARNKVKRRHHRCQKSNAGPSNTLTIQKANDEILTDVENLDSSDDDTTIKNKLAIPAAVINSNSNDAGLTDVEDFEIEEDCIPSYSQDIKLPSPIREITLMTEDGQGDPITKVMPLNSSGTFLGVIESYVDKGLTDTEDLSGNEEDYINSKHYSMEVNFPELDGGVVDNVESLSSATRTKRFDLSYTEPITDVEELFMGDKSARKRKPKQRYYRNRQFLGAGCSDNERGATDVEELYVSDDQAKHFQRIQKVSYITVPHDCDGGVTDTEELSADEDEFDKPFGEIDVNVFKQEAYYSTITSSDGTLKEKFMNNPIKNDQTRELSADTEDLQFTSDTEDLLNIDAYSRAETITPIEIRNALDETCNFSVYDHSDSRCDRSNEGAHIKGYRDIQDAHTDVEFLEDDKSNIEVLIIFFLNLICLICCVYRLCICLY